jgi:hypothetical protein
MAARTIRIEQLKQAIQLQQDGINISEITRKLGINPLLFFLPLGQLAGTPSQFSGIFTLT